MIETEVETHYVRDNCYRWTFQAKKVKKIVENNCQTGLVLNLFAGKTRLNGIVEVRVDKSGEWAPDYYMSAETYLAMAKKRAITFKTILYDPPWNERKAKEFYGGRYIGKFTRLKNDIVKTLGTNGIIISVGYEVTNFGETRGMELTKVYTIDPRGESRTYFIAVERKRIALLTDFVKEVKK
jgi:hypothetical protein